MEKKKKEIIMKKEIANISKVEIRNDFRELKREKINIEIHITQKFLHQHSLKADIQLFKKIYLEDGPKSPPIIQKIKNNYQYWLNNCMCIDDENGSYIKNIIISNLSNLYLELNVVENYDNDIDLFLKNQDYIIQMETPKYKDRLFKQILKAIDL